MDQVRDAHRSIAAIPYEKAQVRDMNSSDRTRIVFLQPVCKTAHMKREKCGRPVPDLEGATVPGFWPQFSVARTVCGGR
jgi:hypothetical protein